MLIQRTTQALRIKLQSLSRAGFLRSVGVLVGGTAIAQVLTVFALPVVTRLYTPDDFSVLAVYSSILAIISVVACLRLEIAIPIPECDKDGANLMALALCISTIVAGLTALAVWWFPDRIVSQLGQPGLRPFLWLLPVSIWLTSVYAALQYWTTRKKRFAIVAKTRITQAVGGVSAQLAFGWLTAFGSFGLLLGQTISGGAGLVSLGRTAWKEDRSIFRGINYPSMCQVFKSYLRFPKYSTFEAFINNLGIRLPVIVIAAMAVGPEAGYLLLATRAMAAPMGLIGGAVSQVYLSRAPEEMRAGRLAPFTAKVIGGLLKIGVGPLAFVGIISPAVFPLIFGENWRRAGEMVAWITPWCIIQFLVSPVSMVLHVTGNQRLALGLQMGGFLFRVGVVSVFGMMLRNYIIEAYAVSGLIFYLVYLTIVARLSGINFRVLVGELRMSSLIIVLWIFLGITSVALIYSAGFV